MKSRFLFHSSLLLIFPLLLLTVTIWAGDFPDISVQDLKRKIDTGEKFLLINPLSDIEFNMFHIPGSVNIPIGEIQTTDKLPQDKDTLMVFYCMGKK